MTFDGTATIAEVAEPLAAFSGPWRTTEVATLAELYPKGGAFAVHERLPHRTLASIRAKACTEGIKHRVGSTAGRRFARIHPPRDDIDMMIREAYLSAKKRGYLADLSKRIGRPEHWVQRRASSMGLTRGRGRVDGWTAEELAIVEEWAMTGHRVIVKKLADAGFTRTESAVAVQMKRRQIDRTDPDQWTATQVAPLLGVNPSTVADWVERRGLKAKRQSWGPFGRLQIKRADLKAWVKANRGYVDLRRVDQSWFLELLLGPAA